MHQIEDLGQAEARGDGDDVYTARWQLPIEHPRRRDRSLAFFSHFLEHREFPLRYFYSSTKVHVSQQYDTIVINLLLMIDRERTIHAPESPSASSETELDYYYDVPSFELLTRFVDLMKPIYDEYSIAEREIPSLLQANFRASFKFSTGSAMLQAMLQVRLVDLLSSNANSAAQLAATAPILALDQQVFTVPSRHVEEGRDAKGMDRAVAIWNVFMDICQNRDNLNDLTPSKEFDNEAIEELLRNSDKIEIPFHITDLMIDLELGYIEHGRPNRDSDSSRYRSLIRECAVLGKPTGTPEFDFIMAEVGTVVRILCELEADPSSDKDLLPDCRRGLKQLIRLWEERNKSSFFNQPQVDKIGTDENIGH
jgi:hypothetical protein